MQVKKKFKGLLREGLKAPPDFTWPKDMPEPCVVMKSIVELMRFHREVMHWNFKKLSSPSTSSSYSSLANATTNGDPLSRPPQTLNSIQSRWCCGEDPELFKERWEKLFVEFCEWEKVDPSKISELYDTMKYDALHNRQFLETIFLPPPHMLEEKTTSTTTEEAVEEGTAAGGNPPVDREGSAPPQTMREKLSMRRRSMLNPSPRPSIEDEANRTYTGPSRNKAKDDIRLAKLRELYRLAKVLFDFVAPNEYGILPSEKLEIGLLTCLPLLKQIVKNLEAVQASPGAKSFFYFTKESHVYTLLNCIIQGGLPVKLPREGTIPELDYLTQICFELYESEQLSPPNATDGNPDPPAPQYSIRITLSPGCHADAPLDLDLDSKHCIGCAPRRSLTSHGEWKSVLGTLRGKFDQVKLPRRFLPVLLRERDN